MFHQDLFAQEHWITLWCQEHSSRMVIGLSLWLLKDCGMNDNEFEWQWIYSINLHIYNGSYISVQYYSNESDIKGEKTLKHGQKTKLFYFLSMCKGKKNLASGNNNLNILMFFVWFALTTNTKWFMYTEWRDLGSSKLSTSRSRSWYC